jgi:hypothetical protein
MVRLQTTSKPRPHGTNFVSPPARKLESVFRFVEDRTDIVDANDCCAKFLEDCVGAFGDKSGERRLATAANEPVSALPLTFRTRKEARSPRWTPQNDAAQGAFLDEGGEEGIRPDQMSLADKLVQRVWS